ncbi:MAG: DNA methyltransferase [Phycisphaerae bacterium]|nr:DNA methyltransferase [Phycisphaerae bacterium]
MTNSNINSEGFRNSIINGDCLNLMPQLPARSVNFILTDPPYLINYKSRDGRKIINDNNEAWLQPAFAEMYRLLENQSFGVSFYGWQHADKFLAAYRKAGFRVIGHLTFPKRYTSFTHFLRYQHESAYLLAKGYPKKPASTIGDVIDWTYSGNKLHPTQKPLSVLLPLVETFSAPEGLVFDPFAGSGSSLLAAKSLGRSYLGIELDQGYHATASSRLASG